MSNYSRVNVKFGADISEFSTAMQNAVRDMTKAANTLTSVGMSLTKSLTLPIVALGGASVYAYGEIDKLKRGLVSVMGTAGAASKEFSDLVEIAKLPGLGLEEVTRGDVNLQAIGLTATESKKAISELGNAIATVGGGRENFDLAIRGFGQLANASKPLQQDLYQIANQVPQINKILIETFGTNRAEDLAKLGLSGKQLADILIQKLGELPRATGGISNAFENLRDSVKVSLASVGEAIDKNLGLTDKVNAIGEAVGKIAKWFSNLSPEIQSVILGFTAFAAAIGPLLVVMGAMVNMLPLIATGLFAIANAFPYIRAIGLVISSAALAISYFGDKTEKAVSLNDRMTASIAKEQSALDMLFNQLRSTNGLSDERSRLITQINSQYGTTIKNIKDESKFIAQLAVEYDKVITKIKDKIVLEAVKGRLEDSIKKQIELEDLRTKKLAESAKIKADIDKANAEGTTAGEISQKQAVDLTKQALDLEMRISTQKKYQMLLMEKYKGALNSDIVKKPENPQLPNTTAAPETKVTKQLETLAEELQIGYEFANTEVVSGNDNLEHTFSEGTDKFVSRLEDMRARTKDQLEKWKEQLKQFSESTTRMLNDLFVDAIVGVFDQLGTNLATQQDPFKDVGKRMLESVAGFLQKLGSLWITMGTATAVIEANIENPYVVIAAGAAMVAAGAAIKATMKQGPTGISAAGATSSNSSYTGAGGEDLTLYTRLDGRDLVLSGQRQQALSRR